MRRAPASAQYRASASPRPCIVPRSGRGGATELESHRVAHGCMDGCASHTPAPMCGAGRQPHLARADHPHHLALPRVGGRRPLGEQRQVGIRPAVQCDEAEGADGHIAGRLARRPLCWLEQALLDKGETALSSPTCRAKRRMVQAAQAAAAPTATSSTLFMPAATAAATAGAWLIARHGLVRGSGLLTLGRAEGEERGAQG